MPHDEETMPRSEDDWRDYVARKFRDGDVRMGRMEGDIKNVDTKVDNVDKKVDANTVITESIKEDTAGLVEAWNIGKNTSKAAQIVGSVAISIVKWAVAIGVLWAAFKGAVNGKLW